MHDFDAPSLCKLVEAVRVVIPEKTEIVFNIGDCPESWWREFKAAGVSGAYHVLRLRDLIALKQPGPPPPPDTLFPR